MTHLHLSLLGPFIAARDDEPLSGFESNKVRALLAFLAVEHERPQQRIELATLLWPDMDDASALRNLRHAVANLRRLFGDARAERPLLLVTPRTLRLNPDAVSNDAAEFRSYLARAAEGGDAAIEAWQAAVDLVRGIFLEGLRVRGSAPWDEWLALQRETFRQEEREALRKLARAYEQRRDYDRALAAARRWVQNAPWDEEAYRQLMRLLALDGRRAAALAQYERCRQLLKTELNLQPTAETTALAQAIRDNTFPGTVIQPPRRASPAGASTAAPPFVAREQELAQLHHFLDEALARSTQFVFITGEAGSGKSALATAFGRQALSRQESVVVAWGESNAFAGRGDPFLPFRDILLALIGDVNAMHRGAHLGDAYVRRLQQSVPAALSALAQQGPDLIAALALTPTLIMQMEAFLPESARKRTMLQQLRRLKPSEAASASHQSLRFTQFTQVLAQLAERYPLLLILDDLQWADPGSLSLLFHLGHRLQSSPVLVLGLFRSEDVLVPATEQQPRPHPLALILRELQRRRGNILIDLDRSAGRAFVDAYLDTEPNRLDEQFRRQLFRHTGGHALFTAELLSSLQDQGYLVQGEGGWHCDEALNWEKIPPRVEAIIADRIASLPSDWRLLLKVASVAGESFAAEALAMIMDWPPADVQRILDAMTASPRRWVQFQGRTWLDGQRLSAYRFRHILFQHYLYNQLTEGERTRWHENLGQTLEQIYASRLESVAPGLARHFEAAQRPLKGASYALMAGKRAMRLFAPEEALAWYSRGLAMLPAAPDSPEKEAVEMELQMAMTAPLVAMSGWGSRERMEASQRAYDLCRHSGNERALMQALFIQADMLRARGEHALSWQLGEQLLALARREGAPEGLALAHWTLGETALFQGETSASHHHLTQALHYYAPSDQSFTPLTAVDLGVVCHVWLAWLEALTGRDDAGRAHVQAALTLARDLKQPLSLIFALTLGAYGYNWLLDRPGAAAAYADELAPLMADESLIGIHPWGDVFQGWAMAELGRLAEGVHRMERGMAAWRSMGAVSGLTCQGLPLARAYLWAGREADARNLILDMLSLIERTGERMFEKEWRALQETLSF